MVGTGGCDVLGLGCVAVDDLFFVDRYPAPDEKVMVRERYRQCGGLTATALVTAARLGASCAYAGMLGENELSAFVRNTLEKEGIDTSRVVPVKEAAPIHAIVIVDIKARTRTIINCPPPVTGAHPELPPAEVIEHTKVLLVDHWGAAGMLRAAGVAKAAGIPVVADFELTGIDWVAPVMPLVDHLIVPESFALRYTGESDARAAAMALVQPGRKTVIVTQGARGGVYVDAAASRPVVQTYGIYPVEVVDTTGCGDVFHGAYCMALVKGWPLEERVRFASAVAALKATKPGGQAGIPRVDEVFPFMKTNRPVDYR